MMLNGALPGIERTSLNCPGCNVRSIQRIVNSSCVLFVDEMSQCKTTTLKPLTITDDAATKTITTSTSEFK